MTVFWIVSAFLVAAALLFVIPPMFRRDDVAGVDRGELNVSIYQNQLVELEADLVAGDVTRQDYDKSRQEIERRLLEEANAGAGEANAKGKSVGIGTSVFVALMVPVLTVGLYLEIGTPGAMDPKSYEQSMVETSPHGDETNMAAQIEKMVGQLYERLQENPSDIQGWVMLGRSYSVLGRFQEAKGAFEKALQFAGDDPDVLADYADAYAMASGDSLEGRPMEMLAKALTIAPQNQKALWLMATGLLERGDFAGALKYWQRLHSLFPADSQEAQTVAASIAETRSYLERQKAGEFGAVPEEMPLIGQVEGVNAVTVSGTISLSADLADKVSESDSLFVFAKAVNGPPMPLAIIRSNPKELPLAFTLDDSMAMMPSMKLSSFDQVIIGARVSKSGNATAQAGDLEGFSQAVAVGSDSLNIVIDTVVQ